MTSVKSRMLSTSSLPLMGIGNSRAPPSAAPAAPSHYPSWGSETRKGPDEEGNNTELITPHGDRKPADLNAFVANVWRSSLPLMGIGNPYLTRK